MLRIIHYVPNLNCTSGITNMIMNYYRNIDRKKVQFDFIYFMNNAENNFSDEIKKLGGRIVHIDPPTKYFSFRKQLKQYFNNLKDDDKYIFHNHQIAFTILLYQIVKRYGKMNFIVHNHMTKYSDKKLSAIRNYIMSIPIKYMKKINLFACSDDAAKLILGRKKRDYYVMNNGIDIKKYAFNDTTRNKVRKRLKIDNKFVVGHVGRFEKVKNHEFIINVFKRILEYDKNSVLLLIGTGTEEDNIRKLIIKEKINDSVIILQNRKDVPELLMAMDVFIFPSKFEGLGISAIEAQASGLPVIMSDNIPSVVNVCNVKILSLNENYEEWANHIMVNKKIDRLKCNDILSDTIFNIRKNIVDIQKIYFSIIK